MRTKNYFLHLTFIFILLSFVFANATIRYVSHTGSSTPPYLTWETAADSIQKCINYSVDGDTIIVANGVYYESLIISKYLWLTGLSMDSTVINGAGLANNTVDAQSDFNIAGFTIIGKGREFVSSNIISSLTYNVNVVSCRMLNAGTCISAGSSSGKVTNVILSDCLTGFGTFCYEDTCHPEISNSVLIMEGSSGFPTAIKIFDGGSPTIFDNILIGDFKATYGIGISFSAKTVNIKNNIISGFAVANIESRFTTDSAIIENNLTSYQSDNSLGGSIYAGSESHITNNIITHSGRGIGGSADIPETSYNLFWNNDINTTGGVTIDSTDVLADPMVVKDTIPAYGGTYDYHLQAYSPAIDSGDPNILDVDGTRSDIGAYGGLGGEMYTYIDLPPRPPVNLDINIDSLITLTWNKNTEADTAYYNVYRDTVANFTIDSTKLVGSSADTFFIQTVPQNVESLYFKITAVDQQGNESLPSEEVGVLITSVNEYKPIVNDYILYQNYPNPFNPSTKIGYKLIERGYVKILVYDITGSLVTVLVNEIKEAGYHEVIFNVGQESSPALASGIYLYRIEVIGEGNIPRFSDMKKMILIK